MTNIETYRVTVKYDNGKRNLTVTTLSGMQNAIKQVVQSECCPPQAVQTVRLIRTKTIK